MAPDDALRARLEALNRGPLPTTTTRPAQRSPPTTAARPPWRSGAVPPLPGLMRRGEAVATDAGAHWRICLALDEVWPGGEQLVRRRSSMMAQAVPAHPASADCWWSGLPDETVFLDLETCGLSGSALFLAGLLRSVEGRLTVELLLARDYSQESAVLASLWKRMQGAAAVVTFNGKSFDWPMVLDRSRRHLLDRNSTAAPPRHVDLLRLARRRWRRELPDCKLQTLESRICGRLRGDDLPGNQIPAAYAQFVRTGFEREMDAILRHNAVDLVTMLDLAIRLASHVAA